MERTLECACSLAACDVSSVSTKGLGEGAHHDVDVLGVNPCPLCTTPARLAESPYAVRLIQEEVCLQKTPKSMLVN